MDNNDIIISSRVRLARNVSGLPFPHKLRYEKASMIAKQVYDAIAGEGKYNLYRVATSQKTDLDSLKEKHLISEDLLHAQNGAAIINDAETVSIMINEEDHIREQCIMRGFELERAHAEIDAIDDIISRKIKIAYDDRLGYITCCPTNIGTGLRASVMLFLPALSLSDDIERLAKNTSKLNFTVRGVYGEGSRSDGFLYQVSNSKSLGISEREIISSVNNFVGVLVEQELKTRSLLFRRHGAEIKDKVGRAWGLLTNAYRMNTAEFMEHMAFVRLGASDECGLIEITDRDRFERLMTEAQPANLVRLSGGSLDDGEVSGNTRDVIRAAYVAKTLKAIAFRK